mmetsp:Transcript_27933/g.41241  ORF Transcript_27933/g.41241 Transcript_27933/m.41241 type:complete len:105 (+) Transcript_27933:1012-1326(+)
MENNRWQHELTSSVFPSLSWDNLGSIGSNAVAKYPNKHAEMHVATKRQVTKIDATSGRFVVQKKKNSSISAGSINHVEICIFECGAANPLRRFDIVQISTEAAR